MVLFVQKEVELNGKKIKASAPLGSKIPERVSGATLLKTKEMQDFSNKFRKSFLKLKPV